LKIGKIRRLEMHNIDRTQLETEWESGNYEFQGEQGGYGEVYGEYSPELYGEAEGPFNEAEEMEMAAELLSISNEDELDHFLGSLFKKVAGGIGKIAKNPIFQPLGGILKGIAKKALPLAGGALGSMIPIPGVGTALGAAAGNAVGNMFGLELEGMSAEDQEFEVARRFVRLAGDAAEVALNAPPSVPPQQVAQTAVASAAQKHAPGLVNASPQGGAQPRPLKHTGRWIRRGRSIIILGLHD
jgi:hypothetical protein